MARAAETCGARVDRGKVWPHDTRFEAGVQDAAQ
jgi:hypothetical protein